MPAFASLLIVFSIFSTSLTLAADKPQDNAQTTAKKPVIIQSIDLIVVSPQSRDKLMAYSMQTNTWDQIAISVEPDQKVEPTVSRNMAACQLGQSIYAYSAKAGVWSRLKLPPESKARLQVGDNAITASVKTKQGSCFYIFGTTLGKWSGIDLATGKQMPIEQDQK
ncbi:hypothetical protein [uncultured Gimesia sp.]|uniref:hypothetical protein n=1 Tax=uncultured Gimesia sp. TaxID=1678688 RepID=UPI0030D924F4|tara:strand:- start:13438 stop:13935 length:498 start_codon:yes stop_codon:yes gene_type:complete